MSESLAHIPLKEKLQTFFDDNKELEVRLKAAQEFSDSFEYTSQTIDFPDILKELYERSQRFLMQTESQFLQENPVQQLRKQCLELFQKVPNSDHNKPYWKTFMNTLMKLVEYENEENTIICVKLLIEIHKSQRPNFSNEVLNFLKFVRSVYKELQNHTNKIFTHTSCYEVQTIEDFPLETKILETFTSTKIVTQQRDANDSLIEYNILPKSCYSLKVMQEIPVLLVLMYQFHKSYITNEIASFIPLIMDFLNLIPSEMQKKDEQFNQTLYLDFLAAQVKTLSFLAYVVKFFKKALMEKHADSLVQGMYKMIVNIPSNVTNMRKEYFIAARHILGTQEIKPRFIMVLSDLMNEDILIGNGYTVNQLLRPLSYSTLADLIHFVKSELSLTIIAKATNMYIKNMHDDTLVFSIQQMSMKLLLNFIEPIKNKSTSNVQEALEGRQLLIKILYALIKRLGTISKFYLPKLEKDCLVESFEKSSNITDNEVKVKIEETTVDDKLSLPTLSKIEEKPIKPEHSLILPPLCLQDLKTLTKHLIHGIKTISLTIMSKSTQLASTVTPSTSRQVSESSNVDNQTTLYKDKVLDGFDVKIFCKLIRYCIRMMDLYLIYIKDGQFYQRPSNTPMNAKFTDEKSILDNIAIIFLNLSPANFKEIFQTQIKYIIDRTNVNSCIVQLFQIILSNSQEEQSINSAILANLILTYLLDNMEIIGEATPEANLHIKLFKLIFNSVHANLASFENVLEIHLKRIVLGCMKYALSAKDPSSFMCLLRYLFRSIGGGAHERLYREFLPLLPLMLTGLSSLLRSPHPNQVRDLLGELCVIVPVRLSTLLPHLSLLMEPLVHVLSCNTISQGLRTLELCVDNMSPEYLYQNMYPVRGDIMFAMLQSFRCKNDQVNRTAFKVLGKMGKYNRCDLVESQQIQLDFWQQETGPEIKMRYTDFPEDIISLPWKDIISASVDLLKTEKLDQPNKEKIERVNKAWKLLKVFIIKLMDGLDSVAAISSMNMSMFRKMNVNYSRDKDVGDCQWIGYNPNISDNACRFSDNPVIHTIQEPINLIDVPFVHGSDLKEYEMAKSAITGLLLGCLHDDIRKNQFDFVIFLVEQLSLASIIEQNPVGHVPSDTHSQTNMYFSATRLLADSIIETMAYEDKDAVRIGAICLEKVCGIIEAAVDSKLIASKHFLFNLFANRIVQKLHKPAWYCKWGACATLTLLMKFLHPCWLWENLMDLLKALFYAINDLNLQICQGALKMALECVEVIVELSLSESSQESMKAAATNQEEIEKCQKNYETLVGNVCLHSITTLLSDNDVVREKASAILRQLSKITNRSLNILLHPHLHVFSDILPPSPVLFHGYPVSKQIAVLEINYFFGNHTNCGNCVHYDMDIESQEKFVLEVRNILETLNTEDDVPVIVPNLSTASTSNAAGISAVNITNTPIKSNLGCNNTNQQQCTVRQACAYTDMSTSVALKVAACKLLSTLWYLDTEKDKNFQALFKAMCSKDVEVHEAAFKCLQEFLSHTPVSLELRNANLKPLLTTFRENYSITTNRQLYYCARLFHASFSERMCESLLVSKVKPLLDIIYEKFDKNGYIDTDNDEKFTLLIKTVELFHVLQAASNKYVQTLTELVLKVEQRIYCCATSPLRHPLVLYLAKCPLETVKLFLQNPTFVDNFYTNNFFIDLLDFKEAKVIRDQLQGQVDLLIDLLGSKSFNDNESIIETVVKKDMFEDLSTNMISSNVKHFVIKIIHKLSKYNPNWWINSKRLIDAVNNYWCSNDFKHRLTKTDKIHYSNWKDVDRLLYLLTRVIDHYPDSYQYLFSVARAFKMRTLGSLHKLREYLMTLFQIRSDLWKQKLFRYYVEEATNIIKPVMPDILYVVFAHIVLPAFCVSLEKLNGSVEHMELLGGPPRPNEDVDDIVTVFLNQLIDNQECTDGGLRVVYYQFCILILEYAPSYIHEISNRKKGHKARIIMTFAWPSVTSTPQFTDLLEKYVGLQTIAYLISKFNINRKIIVKVFTCLAKGNSVEPKKVVNAALGVLVSAWLQRKDDLNFLVLHTKKASRDDVTSQSHLHIGNLIVRHSDIYYQAKLHMIPLMQHFIIRLSSQNFQPDQRRCLLDMIELLLRWDIRGKEEAAMACSSTALLEKPLMDQHKDSLANLIVKQMIQILDQSQTNSTLVETSCRRALMLLETALHPMVWGPINLNIEPMLRYFKLEITVSMPINTMMQTQFNNMFMCLDFLTTLIRLMEEINLLQNMKLFSKPLCDILNNPKMAQCRFIKYFGMVMKALLLRYPAEASNKQKITQLPELLDIYNAVLKVIQDAFIGYEQKPSSPNSTRVQSALYLLNMTQQVKVNTYAFVDRCLLTLVNMGHKLVSEIIKPGNNQNEEVEQLIGAIDIIKSRFNVLGADMRRNKVINIFLEAISNTKDVKLLRAVILALRNWMKLPKQEEHFAPSTKDKFELFVRLWTKYSSWSEYPDVQKEILSVLLLIFENEQLQVEDTKNTFQTAFCCGMVCPSFEVREKYLEFFLDGIKRVNILEKFLFLISANDWDSKNFKQVNWIPTFLEVLFMDINVNDDLFITSPNRNLPKQCKLEEHLPMEIDCKNISILDDGFANLSMAPNEVSQHVLFEMKLGSGTDRTYKTSIYEYFSSKNTEIVTPKQSQEFGTSLASVRSTWSIAKNVNVGSVLPNILLLSYNSSKFSGVIFQQFFPQLWQILYRRYPEMWPLLKQELVHFVSSPSHNQHIGQSTPNPMSYFIKAMAKIPNFLSWLYDSTFTFLTSSHNQWFLGIMMMEDCLYRMNEPDKFIYIGSYKFVGRDTFPRLTNTGIESNGIVHQPDYFLSLNSLYEMLEEEDYQFGLWSERCSLLTSEMQQSMAAAQQGQYDKALKISVESENSFVGSNLEFKDIVLQQKFYDFNIKYLKKLGQWDTLDKYLNDENVNYLVKAESFWRKGQWKEVIQNHKLTQISIPESDKWRAQLIYSYSLIMNRISHYSHEDDSANIPQADIEFPKVTALVLQQWKTLPDNGIICPRHVTMLQACNLAVEGWDGMQLFSSFQSSNVLSEVKSMVKSWKNRWPHNSDSFSFWSDIVLWRKAVFDKLTQITSNASNDSSRVYKNEVYLLLLELVRNSRKQHLPSANKYYADKMKQQLTETVSNSFALHKQECKMKMFEEGWRHSYVETLEMLENTDAQKFKDRKDLAKFFCYKAMLFSYFNKGDEATRHFGYALQIDAYNNKIWSIYADFLENVFSNYPAERRQKASHTTGIFAITALVEAASTIRAPGITNSNHSREDRVCSNLAKCLWLVTLDDSQLLMAKHWEDMSNKLPPSVLLPWARSLVACILRPEGKHLIPMLLRLANEYPEAVYVPLRCLKEKLTLEESNNCKRSNLSDALKISENLINQVTKNNGPKLYMIDQLCIQLEWLCPTWSEQLLAQLYFITKQLEDYIYSSVTGSNILSLSDEPLPDNFIIELQHLGLILDFSTDSSMDIDNEDPCSAINRLWSTWLSLSNQEVVSSRYHSYLNSHYFQDIRVRFSNDFGNPHSHTISATLNLLKKVWIPMLRRIVDLQPKSNYLDEKTILLTEIAQSSCELSLPGDLSLIKKKEHRLHISSVSPLVERVWSNHVFGRKIKIRASNGHNFEYYIQPFIISLKFLSSDSTDGGSSIYKFWLQERLLHMFRVINENLNKERETNKSNLQLHAPRLMEVNSRGIHLREVGNGMNPILRKDIDNDDHCIVSLEDIWFWYSRKKIEDLELKIKSQSNILPHLWEDKDTDRNEFSKEVLHDTKAAYIKFINNEKSHNQMSSTSSTAVTKKKISDCFGEVKEHTGNQAFVQFARAFCSNSEDYWMLRKRITNDFATLSMVQWVLQMSSLGPQQYIIDLRKVSMNVCAAELNLFEQGQQDNHSGLPFRLSQNIVQFIQASGDGDSLWKSSSQPFTSGMIATGHALYWCRSNLLALIRALLRDYMIVKDKSIKYNCSENTMDNITLEKWLSSATEHIYKKISGVGTSDDDSVVKDQIQISLDSCNQALMTLSYQSWI